MSKGKFNVAPSSSDIGEWPVASLGADGSVLPPASRTGSRKVGSIAEHRLGGAKVAVASFRPEGYYPGPCEDGFVLSDKGGFAVVDGMGGMGGGDKAAARTTQIIGDNLDRLPEPRDADHAESLVGKVFVDLKNRAITDRHGDKRFDGGAAAGSVAFIVGNELVAGTCGDTRVLVVRAGSGKVESVTKDHSSGSDVYSMLGEDPADTGRAKLRPGDKVIMASDGIFGDCDGVFNDPLDGPLVGPYQFWADDPEHPASDAGAPLIAAIGKMDPVEAVDYLVKNSRKDDDKTVIVIEPKIESARASDTDRVISTTVLMPSDPTTVPLPRLRSDVEPKPAPPVGGMDPKYYDILPPPPTEGLSPKYLHLLLPPLAEVEGAEEASEPLPEDGEDDPWTVFKESGASILRDGEPGTDGNDHMSPEKDGGLANEEVIVDPKQPWMSDKLQSILDKLSKEDQEKRLELIDNEFAKLLGLDLETVTNSDLESAIERKINEDFGGSGTRFNAWAQSLAWTEKAPRIAPTVTTPPRIDTTSVVVPATPLVVGPDPHAPLSFEVENPYEGKRKKEGSFNKYARRQIGVTAVGLATGAYMGFGTNYNKLAVAVSVPVATAASFLALKLKDRFMDLDLSPRAKRGVLFAGGVALLGVAGFVAYKRGIIGGRSSEHANNASSSGRESSPSVPTSVTTPRSTTIPSTSTTLAPRSTTTLPPTSTTLPPVTGGRGGSGAFDSFRFKSSNRPGLVSRIKEMYPDLAPKKVDKVASNILDKQLTELGAPDATTSLNKLASNGSSASNNLMRQEIARQVAAV